MPDRPDLGRPPPEGARDSRPPSDGARDAHAAGTRSVTSSELLGAAGELVIRHEGREYRLRITRNRKLILTA